MITRGQQIKILQKEYKEARELRNNSLTNDDFDRYDNLMLEKAEQIQQLQTGARQ
jgi:hypothetical protein